MELRSRWRAGPARLAVLLLGLVLFGTGEALVVASELGNSPWTVLAQGVSRHTPLSIGSATVVISVVVLGLWVALHERPGIGTVANALVIGATIGLVLPLAPAHPGAVLAWPLLLGGIATVAIGGAIYLATDLGPGPRDGLMTGLSARTGRSIRLVRTLLETSAAGGGFALGGNLGPGTVAFALLVGPLLHEAMGAVESVRRARFGRWSRSRSR